MTLKDAVLLAIDRIGSKTSLPELTKKANFLLNCYTSTGWAPTVSQQYCGIVRNEYRKKMRLNEDSRTIVSIPDRNMVKGRTNADLTKKNAELHALNSEMARLLIGFKVLSEKLAANAAA